MPGLVRYVARRGNPKIYMRYFGVDRPNLVGLRWQTIATPPERPELARAANESTQLLAVSNFFLVGNAPGPNPFEWLRTKKPVKVIGYTIHVFDITSDADSHVGIAKMYESSPAVALVEVARALEIDPSHAEARRMLAALSRASSRGSVLESKAPSAP